MNRRVGFAAAAVLIAMVVGAVDRPAGQGRAPKFEVDPSFPSHARREAPRRRVVGDGRWTRPRLDDPSAAQRAGRSSARTRRRRCSSSTRPASSSTGGAARRRLRMARARARDLRRGHRRDLDQRQQRLQRAGTPPPPGNSDDMLLKFTPAGKFVLQVGHSGKSAGDADHDNVKQAADMRRRAAVERDLRGRRVRQPPRGGVRREEREIQAHVGRQWRHAVQYRPQHPRRRTTASSTWPIAATNASRCSRAPGDFKQQVMIGGETPAMQTAAGLAFSPDRAQQFLYVADLGNNVIDILDRQTMKTLGTVGKPGAAARRVRHAARNRDRLEGEHLHGGDQPQQARAEVCV